jgi:phosphopantetheine adenylyltransferase
MFQLPHSKGLTVDLAKANATNFILRGLRDSSDFDNEAQNALMNKTLDNSIETYIFDFI